MGIPEEEYKKKKRENLFKAIIAESFPTWGENGHLDSWGPKDSK